MRAVLVLAVLAAGCLESLDPPGGGDEEWVFGGAWTQEFTQADLDAWCEIARAYGNECAIMESYPPQYALRFDDEPTCREARAKVLALEHVSARKCARVVPTDEPDAPTSSPPATPPPGARGDVASYDVRVFEVSWTDPEEGRTRALEWDVVRVWQEDGLVTLNVTTHGIEGGDFRFRLWYTPADPPHAVYFHEPGGRAPGTFDFLYNESPFWSGDTIDRIESVARASSVRVAWQDDASGELEGTFMLDFVGSCSAGPDCAKPAAQKRRVLEGRFGP